MTRRNSARRKKTASSRQRWHIEIADQQNCLALPRPWIRRIVVAVLQGEGRSGCDLSLAFVGDDIMARLHQRFLGIAQPTDVLTFPLEEDEHRVVGEIVISTETAARQARQRCHDPVSETLLYLIHGLLHLCGFDDTTFDGRRQMQQRQRHYLRQVGLRLRAG